MFDGCSMLFGWFRLDFGWMFDWFWMVFGWFRIDIGWISHGFWIDFFVDFGWISHRFWMDFCVDFGSVCILSPQPYIPSISTRSAFISPPYLGSHVHPMSWAVYLQHIYQAHLPSLSPPYLGCTCASYLLGNKFSIISTRLICLLSPHRI